MPEVKPKYVNGTMKPYETVSRKVPHTAGVQICPQCGKQAAIASEFVHPNYKCTMIQWVCPRCRHIWNTKKKGSTQ